MEGYDYTFGRSRKVPFDDVPRDHRVQLFGVDYVHIRGMQSGDLYITREGWPVVECVVPEKWFVGDRFSRVGRALAGATGAVYRVPVEHPVAKDFALVVKFCRFGQDTLVTAIDPVASSDRSVQRQFAGAEFLSPFEEFGNLMRLRRSSGPRIRTKHPLAIYSPATRYLDWELGRRSSLKDIHSSRLLSSQSDRHPGARINYDWERMYVLVYRWIDGLDTVQAMHAGLLSQHSMLALTDLARKRLAENGFIVLDHKPRHVIVRPKRNGDGMLSTRDEAAWALVDYELLFPLSDTDSSNRLPRPSDHND